MQHTYLLFRNYPQKYSQMLQLCVQQVVAATKLLNGMHQQKLKLGSQQLDWQM